MNVKLDRAFTLGRNLAVVVGITVLVGCASYERIDKAPEVAEEAFRIAVEQAAAQREGRAPIQVIDEPWISTRKIDTEKSKRSLKLPAARDCRITLIADAPLTLSDFAQIITADCRLPVRVSQDAWAAIAGGTVNASVTPAAGSSPLVPGLGIPRPAAPSLAPNARNFAYSTSGEKQIQPIRWVGKPLSGLLDVVTSQLGVSWSYRSDGIVIHYLDTRTFRIALSSELDYESNVSSGATLTTGSSNGGVGASSNEATNESAQKTVLSIKSRFSADVQKSIEAMLTPGVGQQALSPSIGTLTVTDTPDVLDRIAQYIDKINERMSRQAMLYVTVASVTLTDSDSLGINWNLVWQSASGNYGAGLMNALSPLEGASSVGFGILDTATGRAGQFAGTQAILSALSKQGAVSIMRQRGVTTQHLQPTPIHLTNEEQYVCGRSQTNTAQVGSTESIQMCSVVTGFAMDILPDIHGQNLTLQFSLNMSPPAVIQQVPGDPDKPVFIASVDRQVFLQRVGMRSGQTLVISDFQEASETSTKQGIGGTSTWIPTGGGVREKARKVLVIIISPRIMPNPMDIEDA
ncbi:PilN family type IV pilus biogenesis protein [Pusillimonas sp. T7-7]|uniref:PilN family type IVB pilus formation outer membrane protein n=1 Tax=Pusillimonas sp. (strain T7-7) TaxID=1007105 RepID=UPI0002084C56|nr:PilN family type IVB pilus formation outer membrane protein [Pusillimonas sp. T7-7]AEC18871.1 PilN family type IV pilus biogenesis protein [Pusillimonas sp. T7-7]